MPYPFSRVSRCLTLSGESTSPEGAPAGFEFPLSRRTKNHTCRDVTDHLQLLLRKAGHHLHTTAEFEVVRTIKEKSCYVALNPQKEEKESANRPEDFKLPDGNTIQVRGCPLPHTDVIEQFSFHSWAQNASELLKFSSTRNLSAKNMLAFTKSS